MDSDHKDDLLKALQKAIRQQEFTLHYQPQFSLKTLKVVGIEALLRWVHPEKGLLLPHDFIQHIEEHDLIVPLGEWVLQTACRHLKKWQDEGLQPIRIAVNVSEKQFMLPEFVEVVRKILHQSCLTPATLELELSENLIINDENEQFIKAIKTLKKDGVQIALDDFGAGYSTISHLQKIPVDRIKIDRTYVQNIHTSDEDAAIVKSLISFASKLNLQVLAEGVENLKQLEILTAFGCEEAQGYYFSHPLPPETVDKFLLFYQNNAFQK